MPNDPRLAIAIEYLGLEHRYAETMLARIDAVDPMRRRPSGEAVRAARDKIAMFRCGARFAQVCSNDMAKCHCRELAHDALTAALAVMAEESVAPADPGEGHISASAALAVMRGEVQAAPNVIAHVTKFAQPPEPVPDPPPEWTAEQREAVLTAIKGLFVGVQDSMDVLTVRRVVFDAEQKFLAAFARPEPVWPPENCRWPKGHKCQHECTRTDCPHAGERANG